MKILVVEASQLYQEHLKERLSALGYDVFSKTTGKEGVEMLKAISFDVVVVPMFLPDMKGSEFCAEFRRREENQSAPIFMITSSEDPREREAASVSGITEIFHKDDIGKLLDYLLTFISQTRQDDLISGRILYVEDSLTVANGNILLLKNAGFEVTHFTNAEEAIASLKSHDYDLVLTDVILEKRMSGIGLVRTLRRMDYRYASLPILAMTGFDDVARRIELLHAGVNDYVSTPVLGEELIARVRNLIKSKMLFDLVTKQHLRSHQMAITDQLTMLYNRHFLMEVGPKRISESYRHHIPLSLVIADIDYFKAINDNHGHAAGDLVLSRVGDFFKTACRNEEIAIRYGGEEFILMLSYCDETQTCLKSEALRASLSELKPCGHAITASFGLAALPFDRKYNLSQFISAADKALYQAKNSGRNCVVAYRKDSEIEHLDQREDQ